jgi:DNA (cytosine-5)-methyltransferase 1
MNVLELFAGIGGIGLGFERAGMMVVGQVERDPYCRSVLAAHWPEVARHDDVRTAVRWWRSRARPPVDVVAGGFPCQPFSIAGRQRRGIADARWGWPWMADVIAALAPSWVVIENVPALVRAGRAFDVILTDLAALRFDAEWGVVPACAMGAPHTRRRLFIVAYPDRVARTLADQYVVRPGSSQVRLPVQNGGGTRGPWLVEPRMGRVADGIPDRVDRLRCLGNAVVPAVAQYIGMHIAFDQEKTMDDEL